MPRADKTIKTRKLLLPKMGRNEKEVFEAMSHIPKFPSKLVGLRKHRKSQ